eukprot:g4359.t1
MKATGKGTPASKSGVILPAAVIQKAKLVADDERRFTNLPLVQRITTNIREALDAFPDSEELLTLFVQFDLQRDELELASHLAPEAPSPPRRAALGPSGKKPTFESIPRRAALGPSGEDPTLETIPRRAALGPSGKTSVFESIMSGPRPWGGPSEPDSDDDMPVGKDHPRASPFVSPTDEAFASVPSIAATETSMGPDGRMYSTVVRGGISTRDSVKRRALGFAEAADLGRPTKIPMQILAILNARAATLSAKCPFIQSDYGPGARFSFLRKFIEYAESRVHLVRSMNPLTPADARAMFAVVLKTPRLIITETQRRHLATLPERPLDDLNNWIFMTGKFDIDDIRGDFKAALVEIGSIYFGSQEGSVAVVSKYFERLEAALSRHNCFPQAKKIVKAVEKAVEKIGEPELSRKWRCAWDEWWAGRATRGQTGIREVRRTTMRVFREYEDQRLQFFRKKKPGKDAQSRGVRTRGQIERDARTEPGEFRTPKPGSKAGNLWAALPKKGKELYKSIRRGEKGKFQCWFCKEPKCYEDRYRKADRTCPKAPEWYKKLEPEDKRYLFRTVMGMKPGGGYVKKARSNQGVPAAVAKNYAGVASVSSSCVPLFLDDGLQGKGLDGIIPEALYSEMVKEKQPFRVIEKNFRVRQQKGFFVADRIIETSVRLRLPEAGGRPIKMDKVLLGVLPKHDGALMEIALGRNVAVRLGLPTLEESFTRGFERLAGETLEMSDEDRSAPSGALSKGARANRVGGATGILEAPEAETHPEGKPELSVPTVFDPLCFESILSSGAARLWSIRPDERLSYRDPPIAKRSSNEVMVRGRRVVGRTPAASMIFRRSSGLASEAEIEWVVVDDSRPYAIIGHAHEEDQSAPGLGGADPLEDETVFKREVETRIAAIPGVFPDEARSGFRTLATEFRDVFREELRPEDGPARHPPFEYALRPKEEWPRAPKIRERLRSAEERATMKRTLQRFKDAGIIQEVSYVSAQEYRKKRRLPRAVLYAKIEDVRCHPFLLVKKRKKSKSVVLGDGSKMEAPMWIYRVVICLDQWLNKVTIPTPMPPVNYDRIWQAIAGSRAFGSFDFLHAYFQFEVAKKQRHLCCFAALGRVYALCRLPQGAANSGFQMQSVLTSVLQDVIDDGIALQADDGLVYAKGWKRLLQVWRSTLERLRQFNIKIKLSKVVFCDVSVPWCGRLIDRDGVGVDPERTRALLEMPDPENLADLMAFIYGAAWSRQYMPAKAYQESFGALLSFINENLKGTKRTKAAASRKTLESIGFGQHERSLLADAKKVLAGAIGSPLAFREPDKRVHVFTDASDDYWAAAIYQGGPEWPGTPLQPLAFYSGAFKGSERNWTIPEKEGYAIVQGIEKGHSFMGRTGWDMA